MATKLDKSGARNFGYIVRSTSAWNLPLRELWQHLDLLYFLVWRDIKVRYKQTVLGMAWAVIQPLMIALSLSLFLGRLAKMPSDGLPYPIFAYSAMAVWQLFAQALTGASNSLLVNERLITKVYFPRLVVPLSAVLASLLDFAIAFAVLIFFLAYYRIVPTVALTLLPFLVLLTILIASGVGFWLAALNVKYRDVRYTLGFLVQFWFLVSPIAYPSSVVPERWRMLYGLNPMVGVLEGFRWALRGSGTAPLRLIAVSTCVSVVIFMIGLYYFQRTEDDFADNI
jgi:lipopolysaccharide transport system permease protein